MEQVHGEYTTVATDNSNYIRGVHHGVQWVVPLYTKKLFDTGSYVCSASELLWEYALYIYYRTSLLIVAKSITVLYYINNKQNSR